MSSTKGAERLTGRTAIVTGASRGIGLEVSRLLVSGGVRVALIARDQTTLGDVAAALGARATPIVCDVSRADAVVSAVARITSLFGAAPDILVNNAGAFAIASVDTVEPAAFDRVIETNVSAPLRFVRAFLPGMRVRGTGHVVTIGSVADRTVFPGNAAYAASKHAVRALHEVLRLETRASGIRATLISPGPVDTALWDAIDPDNREGFTPRSMMLRPRAVAEGVLYALSQPDDVNIDELRLSRA
jgi:NADP-dependent 3-hydroxy acid dehydrogenase YdfG